MTSAAFNLDEFDDGPTLVTRSPVFHTAPMDRRQMPPPISGVMPVSRPAPTPISKAPSYSPDVTHPALRVRRDLAGTRRLAVTLAIGFAFLFGLAGAFVFQTMNAEAAPPPLSARAPRSLTERSSSLDTKSTPDAVPHSDAPIASAPRTRTRTKRPSAAPPVVTEAGDETPTTTTTHAEDPSLEGRDLLGEGLGAP